MGFGSRQPTSNDQPRKGEGKSPWLGESDCVDEFALKLNGLAKQCVGQCKRMTHIRHLDKDGLCPDCRSS